MTIAELREAVLLRDRECIAFTVDRSHVCRDLLAASERTGIPPGRLQQMRDEEAA